MANPIGVFEDIQTAARRRLFTVWGIPWLATPWAWLSIPAFLFAGVLIATFSGVGGSGEATFGIGLVYGALLFGMNILHTAGHMLSSTLVGARMDAVLVTATRHITLYNGPQDDLPSRIHVGRALGGPLMNIAVGLVALALAGAAGGRYVGFFGTVNLVVGLVALLPIRSVDGEVIWREMRGGR
jgi:hypothetical protein